MGRFTLRNYSIANLFLRSFFSGKLHHVFVSNQYPLLPTFIIVSTAKAYIISSIFAFRRRHLLINVSVFDTNASSMVGHQASWLFDEVRESFPRRIDRSTHTICSLIHIVPRQSHSAPQMAWLPLLGPAQCTLNWAFHFCNQISFIIPAHNIHSEIVLLQVNAQDHAVAPAFTCPQCWMLYLHRVC